MATVPAGIYISVPFCRTKCSYCNFASDVFSRAVFERYVDRVCSDIANAERDAANMGGKFEREVDSIYLGGGTPTVLELAQLQRLFDAVRAHFSLTPDAEVTVECAPGTLSSQLLEALPRCGVNRVSLGVQSFIDREAAAVGRLHKQSTVLDDIAHLRAAGISNINIDLIAGLPHQTPESWQQSLQQVIATEVPHASVYMLEVDDDSRLGRELIAGGTRYHAHFVPDDDGTADFYLKACETLRAAGVPQYEISNFSRPGFESRHNLKYWTRQPYLGFGVDAHSMLLSASRQAVRLATPDVLEKYVSGSPLQRTPVSIDAALEETFFLGLRLNRGVNLARIAEEFGQPTLVPLQSIIADLEKQQLLERCENSIRLTQRGRLLSNEVFQHFLTPDPRSLTPALVTPSV
ncbi:MAG TPA: radical SAM family heme chaperone HemW [Candidatus Sulfotelmatobacter sp.]